MGPTQPAKSVSIISANVTEDSKIMFSSVSEPTYLVTTGPVRTLAGPQPFCHLPSEKKIY
ncbi:unnamed protein product [Gulo gulo]|uniref:Uncharacterized protein n=1 Tax=Gulo gulo TaxID=48420 RepID=A0A9X9PVP4_GULGU|nr:unnamed protein product [Gulo gulo]